MKVAIIVISFFTSFVVFANSQPSSLSELIVDKFQSHWLVAIGENHRHQQLHELILKTLSEPEVLDAVQLIVVEFGNQSYQTQVDDYLSGKSNDELTIVKLLSNTVISPNRIWDSPVYLNFFKELRKINQNSRSKNYRVILGDTQIDWSTVSENSHVAKFYNRSEHMYNMIEKFGYRAGQKVLFIAGGLHTNRENIVRKSKYGFDIAERSVISRVEHKYPNSTYVIRSVARTKIGNIESTSSSALLFELSTHPIGTNLANQISTLKNRDGSKFDAFKDWRLKDIADSIVYWGHLSNNKFSYEPEQISEEYLAELNRRSMIVRNQPYR